MLDPFAATALGLAFALAVRHRDRAAAGKLAAEQRRVLGQLVEEVSSLREALVSSGAVERAVQPPAAPAPKPPPPPLPSVKREVVTVTRDDDPIHTRPTVVEAPPPAEPPSAEPPSRERATALPRANADESEDGRDTGEDMTKVYSRKPGEADALIPGVEVKPKPATIRPPHRPPRPIGDPLAGVEPERPKSSASRSAETFRLRPTLASSPKGAR